MHFAGKEIVMKIERVNENQIRCTLNKDDLASRQLKISELAYGSDKAKELFRDMMQQASYEVGFEAEDIPLMIEAIPISADCIVLIVTKVENPEELDTRFPNSLLLMMENMTMMMSIQIWKLSMTALHILIHQFHQQQGMSLT